MSPWLETAGVALVALLGVVVGGMSRRLRGPYWALAYALSLSLIALLALGRCSPAFQFAEPFSWIVASRSRLVVLALAITLGLPTLVPRLPRRWEKVVVYLAMTSLLLWSSILPFLAPALLQDRLANLETTIDANGVCLQTTGYTCGPAAAVTALRRLGLPADEGEIAVLSHASPMTGTFPVSLCKALQNRYAADGLRCRYRPFGSISELRDSGITLAVVKDALLVDHCVAVLDISDTTVTVADPRSGVRPMSREKFEAIWRFCGIVLTRDLSSSDTVQPTAKTTASLARSWSDQRKDSASPSGLLDPAALKVAS